MVEIIINKLGVEDYFFVVDKNNIYNTSDNTELWTLNSESYVAKGTLSSLITLFQYWRNRN